MSKQQNNPSKIIASKTSQLAIQYQNTPVSERKLRNELFMQIADRYMAKIKSDLSNIQPHNRSEFLQIYYVEVLNALNAWKCKSNFDTYLFLYMKGVYRKFMNNIKLFKKDIDCCYLSQLDESEEPTYENLEEFYESYMEGEDE